MPEGDDLLPLRPLALGEDRGLGHDLGARLVQHHPHPLQGGAGRDHVVHEHDLFAADEVAVFLVEVKGLWRARGDGQRLGLDGLAHVRLVQLAQDDVGFLRPHGERVDEGDALGLGGDEEVVGDRGEFLGERARGRLDQLGVAEDVEDGDAQAGFDFEQRQVALHSGDFDGVRFTRWRHDEFPGRDVPAERLYK
jgi:hypothetical protein